MRRIILFSLVLSVAAGIAGCSGCNGGGGDDTGTEDTATSEDTSADTAQDTAEMDTSSDDTMEGDTGDEDTTSDGGDAGDTGDTGEMADAEDTGADTATDTGGGDADTSTPETAVVDCDQVTAATTVTVAPSGQFKFQPNLVNIAPGEVVKWEWNSTAVDHTVTSGSSCTPSAGYDSGLMSNGDFCVRYNDAGTYEYFCTPHCVSAGMTGQVEVQ